MKTSPKRVVSLILLLCSNIAMICMEVHALSEVWLHSGLSMLRYYTHCSNIFALLVCMLSVVMIVRALLTGKRTLPVWTKRLRYTAVSCLMATFLVAALVVTPMNCRPTWPSFRREFIQFMLKGTNLFLHTLCPLVLLLSFAFLDSGRTLTRRDALIPIIPTFIYGVITLLLVSRRVYPAPYPFIRVHAQPVTETILWCIGIGVFAYLIALLCAFLNRLAVRLQKEQ